MSFQRALPLLLVALSLGTSCMAPAPPVVVKTPYGDVRAESLDTARDYADQFAALVPRVQEILPGCQDRKTDLWIQSVLQAYRHQPRPESVRGFTLLRDPFDARRIHLKAGGQSDWYLSHELVHALIGTDWRPLPALLEEGLADVVAERLHPREAERIRAHRLLNASAFTDGLDVQVAYSFPERGVPISKWERRHRDVHLRTCEPVDPALIREILSMSREQLHREWGNMPESFYGLAWFIVSRIVERRGLDGLHEMCLLAGRRGHEVLPTDWILDAAELDLETFDDALLASSIGRAELEAVAYLEPDRIAAEAKLVLFPWEEQFSVRGALRFLQPAIRVGGHGGTELSFRYWPLRNSLYRVWRDGERSRRRRR